MNTFSVKECIAFGWRTFWSKPWLFVQAGVAVTLVNLLFSLPGDILESAAKTATGVQATQLMLFSLIFALISFVAYIYLQIGTTYFTLKAHDSMENASLKDLVHLKGFWRYVGANILMLLAVVAGLILLIVPGIIVGIALSFTLYLVVDKGLGPVAAFKQSWTLTKGNRWTLFLLGLALFGINILGMLAVLVGLLVTVPVSYLASMHAYRILSNEGAPVSEAVSPEVVPA